ncbi:MAG: ATP-binding protein [Candidatus Aminicenantales bacterium]
MIENLRIALRRQKKLIIIFFLTIFLPSVSLSIFGIRAIRNERFRLAKQIETEHRRSADILKTRIDSRFKDIEVLLQNSAQLQAFSEKDYPEMQELLKIKLSDNPLIEQIFLVYRDLDPLFPLFQPVTAFPSLSTLEALKQSEKEKLKTAEECEFKSKKFQNAISLYKQILYSSKNKNTKAQMLNNIGRSYTKLKRYDLALKNYSTICSDYPQSFSSSGLPLCLMARLQLIDCYKNLGETENSLESSLDLYKDILHMTWNLNEGKFKTYASIAKEAFMETSSKIMADSSLEKHKQEFEQLQKLHRQKLQQWKIINDLKNEIIPELRRALIQTEPTETLPYRHSKTIDNRTFLTLSLRIQEGKGNNSQGLLGAKINTGYLKEEVLNKIIDDIRLNKNTNIVIADLSGRILLGETNPSRELATVTELFENNFPPWRIQFFQGKTGSLGVIDIRKSFYFWTIITLIIVLVFGSILIVRTVSHEMEILKIKSDFVSSVSHEFKTPLTSIKALVERLQEGKVKDPAKMDDYFSVISQDADKLTRLVKNILDFSKIEEGKKEYEFVETDVAHLVFQQVKAFQKEKIQKEVKIQTQIEKDVPLLSIDKEALSQALNNLLDNAVKFSPAGKEIAVSVRREAENVLIEIEDKGIGIPQEEINKIFDKFYQGQNALKQSVKGTGLGLTLVKHIIEAHGGRISVKSKPGKGSTFSLIFPVKEKKE